jgi:hypothetical protein
MEPGFRITIRVLMYFRGDQGIREPASGFQHSRQLLKAPVLRVVTPEF